MADTGQGKSSFPCALANVGQKHCIVLELLQCFPCSVGYATKISETHNAGKKK